MAEANTPAKIFFIGFLMQSDAALCGGLALRSWRMPRAAASGSPRDPANDMAHKRCVHAPRPHPLDSTRHCNDFARRLLFKHLFKFRLTEFHAGCNHRG
jgi:hypothetical protein